MDDMKDKMKGFMKKVNNPFSSSSSSFKGQGRVLGSGTGTGKGTSSSSSPSPSTLLNPRPLPKSNPRPTPPPPANPSSAPTEFNPYDPLISSSSSSSSNSRSNPSPFQCPVCARGFPSESDVSSHLDSCLTQQPETNPTSEIATRVGGFLSAGPSENSVEVMRKLLGNVLKDPANEKFRQIRMGNPKIRESVGEVTGGVDLLEGLGFRLGEEGGEVWATMEVPTQDAIGLIKEAAELLDRWQQPAGSDSKFEKSIEPVIEPKNIDRQVRVFFCTSESVAAQIELPDSFYDLSVQEVKKEAGMRRKKLAESQLLVPKSYREKQALQAKRRYKRTVIRIQFPDGVLLQGEFLPWEPTTKLYEFVSSALKEKSLEFELLSPGVPRTRVISHFPGPGVRPRTLEEEELVPSALLKFKPIESYSLLFTGLTDELLESGEPLAGLQQT